MRLSKLAALAAFFTSITLLAGCATQTAGQAAAVSSFIDTATKVCNIATPVATGLQSTMNGLATPLDATDQANIQQAVGDVQTFCATVAIATPADVQALVNTAFPLLTVVINNSSLSDNGKNLAIIGLGVAQTAINVLVPPTTPTAATQ